MSDRLTAQYIARIQSLPPMCEVISQSKESEKALTKECKRPTVRYLCQGRIVLNLQANIIRKMPDRGRHIPANQPDRYEQAENSNAEANRYRDTARNNQVVGEASAAAQHICPAGMQYWPQTQLGQHQGGLGYPAEHLQQVTPPIGFVGPFPQAGIIQIDQRVSDINHQITTICWELDRFVREYRTTEMQREEAGRLREQLHSLRALLPSIYHHLDNIRNSANTT